MYLFVNARPMEVYEKELVCVRPALLRLTGELFCGLLTGTWGHRQRLDERPYWRREEPPLQHRRCLLAAAPLFAAAAAGAAAGGGGGDGGGGSTRNRGIRRAFGTGRSSRRCARRSYQTATHGSLRSA